MTMSEWPALSKRWKTAVAGARRGVQARRRLVEDVQVALAARRRQFAGDLEALALAAGERARPLAQLEVAQPHAVEHPQAFARACCPAKN